MSDQPNQPTNPLAVADATLFSEAEVAEKPKGLFHCRELILANGNAVLVGHNMSTGDRVIRFTTRGTPGGGPVIHPFSLTVQAAVALATQLESSFRDVPYHGPSPIRAARGGSMTLTEGGMPEGAIAWGPTYQVRPSDDGGGARPEPTRREHIIQLSPEQTERLRKWMRSPNGSHRPSSRVGFEAVCNGGLLVRTKPYESEEAERTDSATARAVAEFMDGRTEKQMIDNFDWLYRKMREAWSALARGPAKRRIPPTWQQLAEDVVVLAANAPKRYCTCSDPSNDRDHPCDWCCVERYPKLYQEFKQAESDACGAYLYLCEAVELVENTEADDSDFDRFVDKVEADKGFTAMRERLARIKAASDEVDAIRVAVAKELAADGALANPDDLAVSVRSMVRRLGEWRAVAGRWDEVDAEVRKHPEVRIGCNVQDEAARLIRSHAQLAKAIDEQTKAGARVVKPGERVGGVIEADLHGIERKIVGELVGAAAQALDYLTDFDVTRRLTRSRYRTSAYGRVVIRLQAALDDVRDGPICKPCKSLTCPDCGDDKLADDSDNGNPGWHRCHCGQLHKQAEPCQCVDCGGDKPGHDPSCEYMKELAENGGMTKEGREFLEGGEQPGDGVEDYATPRPEQLAEHESAPLRLEAGKRYVTRSGMVTDPLVIDPAPEEEGFREFAGMIRKNDGLPHGHAHWFANGKWSISGKPNGNDIVAEHVVNETQAAWKRTAENLEGLDKSDPRSRLVELAGELYRKHEVNPEQYPWFAIDEDGEAFAYDSEPGTRWDVDSYWYATAGNGHVCLTIVPRYTMAMLPPWTECLVRMDGPENDSAKRAMEAEPKGAGERVMTAKDIMEARRVPMGIVAPDQPGELGMVENKNSASPIQSQTTGESLGNARQQEAAQCRADRKEASKRFSLLVVIWCGTLLFLLIAGAAVWRILHRLPMPF